MAERLQEWQLRRHKSGQEEPSIQGPHVHSQEQRLHFVGAAMKIPHVQGKRNPSKIVGTERGYQRADILKPQSQTTSQSDHMDHSLV